MLRISSPFFARLQTSDKILKLAKRHTRSAHKGKIIDGRS